VIAGLLTSQRHAVPIDKTMRSNPTWSADGALLAYAHDVRDGVGAERRRGALVVRDRAGRERYL
jgi:hypothetical protein